MSYQSNTGLDSPQQCPIKVASEALATMGSIEALGAVFTRSEVVNFMLDLVGYTEDQALYTKRLLEPSFGGGGVFACCNPPTALLMAFCRSHEFISS
jgi:hypothetical protein